MRELVAMDGKDTSEILLIDSRGNNTTLLKGHLNTVLLAFTTEVLKSESF